MNQVKTDPADIKEQITYCVLNAISGETDPSDEKLREIISDVISVIDIDRQNISCGSILNRMHFLCHRVIRICKINNVEPVGIIYVPVGLNIPAAQHRIGPVKLLKVLPGLYIGGFLVRISS